MRLPVVAILAVSLLLAASPGFAATAPPGDDALKAAKDAYSALKKDEKRRKFRHHWLNVAKKFEAVAQKFPKSERAPEALFLFGELSNELSRFSGNPDDLATAEKAYRRLLEGWPRHRLSDDAALSLAHVLADRKDDPAGAREVLSEALEAANDRKKDVQAMLASLPAPAKAKRPAKPGKDDDDDDDDAPRAAARPTVKAPVKDEKPAKVEVAAKAAKPDAKGSSSANVNEAIRRLSQATAALVKPTPRPEPEELAPAPAPAPVAPPAQARRLPPQRPHDEELPAVESEGVHGSEDVDENSQDAIAALQERLRDVRVGARKLPETSAEAKTRFKQLAKDEAHAELTLAQQLGLKVRRVVVDAGHGGHDVGATGPKGTREKDVALAIAKKLAAKLEEMGLEVVLTRDEDVFVKLEDRSRIANREKGDLFISVHCNAATSKKLHGIETYTLNTSSNRYSTRLAARENATTERGVSDLQYILADLATRANTGESTRLAERVQRDLIHGLSADYKDVYDLGTKEALFFVLLGAKMPAILVETSFISNPEEEQRLVSDEFQQDVANSIAGSLGGFLEERNKLAKVE